MQTTDDDQTDAQHPEEALAPSRRPATLRRARAPTRGMAAAARQDVFSGGTAGGFLAFLQKREDVAEAVRVAVSANLLDAKQDRPGWRGMMAVPPGWVSSGCYLRLEAKRTFRWKCRFSVSSTLLAAG